MLSVFAVTFPRCQGGEWEIVVKKRDSFSYAIAITGRCSLIPEDHEECSFGNGGGGGSWNL